MNFDTVIFHSASAETIIPDKKEVLRYMGQRGEADENVHSLADSVLPLVMENLSPKGCFVLKNLVFKDEQIFVGNMKISSCSLKKNLAGCQSAVVFALTVGIGADRLIASYSSTKPSFALVASAGATAAVEAYADLFCGELKSWFGQKNQYLRPRFSPGYGDFSPDFQRDFVEMTEASKHLGIYLTKAMMMTPTKSVTGIIGVSECNSECPVGGCELCNNKDCIYRR